MQNYHLSDRALASLEAIGEYTEMTWGLKQCDKYLDALHDRFHDLAAHPDKGRSRDIMFKNMRSYHEGHHVIFYAPDEREGIVIVDILHERMEPSLHLRPQA